MAFKKYVADADNTITNAYEGNLVTRGTGSNMGRSDILEVFSLYGQEASSSSELQRVLVKFPITDISTDRTNGVIPISGSVNFFLKLYNAPHAGQVPRNFEIHASAIEKDWQEGTGLDLDNYTDLTYDGEGSNWINAKSVNNTVTPWDSVGGDYHYDLNSSFTASFDTGLEDISIDVTTLVEQWINSAGNVLGSKNNYGFGLYLGKSYEASASQTAAIIDSNVIFNPDGATKSYYTKKFFSRHSEFFFKRPCLEARWNSIKRDDRGAFFFSSSLAPAEDNMNTIYLYNYIRGTLRNIPTIESHSDKIYVQLYSGSSDNSAPFGAPLDLVVDGTHVLSTSPTFITGGYVSTGIYSASFALTGTSDLTKVFDVWCSARGVTQYSTGSIDTNTQNGYGYTTSRKYVLSMPNLQKEYYKDQTARLRLYVRERDWCPNIYTKATTDVPAHLIPSASYRVYRITDSYEVVAYGTGTFKHTGLSYDVSGNYFDLDMTSFEPGYQYGIKYSFKDENTSTYYEQPYTFKFRVVEY